jgi:outer membrane protein OmpA-like peptidoglycan-associated protein/ribosomal protein L19
MLSNGEHLSTSDPFSSDSEHGAEELIDLLIALQSTSSTAQIQDRNSTNSVLSDSQQNNFSAPTVSANGHPTNGTPKSIHTDTPDIWQHPSREKNLQELIDNLSSKVAHLEHQIYEPTELINPLIPLITELLALQGVGSGESMLKALIPIIDEAITQRFQQNQQSMGAAIAQILPEAIAQEIQRSPQSIANAIAPEIGLALQEQIRLDQSSITGTLGPHMGEAIKNQILVERDAMVDALYPVIGNTISKYMGEVVKSINEKVESTLSFQGFSRKIRARLQGVSEAELIFKESVGFSVEAVLLIHKASGLVIRNLQSSPDFRMEADMWSGMLTAIRSFVNECVAPSGEVSELHEIDYDASKIILEVGGYCYLAVVVKGEPSKAFISQFRETLSQIILKYGTAIAAYDGDPAKIPPTLDVLLEALTYQKIKEKHLKLPIGLICLLSIILIPSLFILYRSIIASQAKTKTAEVLDGIPELSIYRLIPDVEKGKLILNGRVPNTYLRDRAGQIVHQTLPQWNFENRIIAVNVPPDPVITAGEVERLTWLFNEKEGVALKTHHDYGTQSIEVTGVASQRKDLEQFIQELKKIPGVATIVSTAQVRPFLKTRFYFDLGSAQLQTSDSSVKLKAIRLFLDQNPGVHLNIIGHSDTSGPAAKNQALGIARARTIQDALISEGSEPSRLRVSGTSEPPPDVTPKESLSLSRCVRFEVSIP